MICFPLQLSDTYESIWNVNENIKELIHSPSKIKEMKDLNQDEIDLKEIESKLQSIEIAQATFSEDCYRIQNDEQQLDFKIGSALENLIDIIDKNKFSYDMEKKLRSHILYSNKFQQQVSGNLVTLLGRSEEYSKNITTFMKSLQRQMNDLVWSVQAIQTDDNNSNCLNFNENLKVVFIPVTSISSFDVLFFILGNVEVT